MIFWRKSMQAASDAACFIECKNQDLVHVYGTIT